MEKRMTRATDTQAPAAELSSYTRAPEHPVELDEFECVGLLRLRVLCALSAWSHGGSLRQEVETLDAFQELFGANGEHAVDTISHYALRLAFCKTRGLIEWMVEMETKLFTLRVRKLQPHEVVEILVREGFKYKAVPSGSHHEGLPVNPPPVISNGSSSSPPPTVKSESLVYKVPFQEAAQLVKRRRVLLKKGICFVPAHSMHVVAEHHFRVSLEQQLKILQRALPANAEARHSLDRLEPILDRFITQSRLQMNGGGLSLHRRREAPQIMAENIDAMAEKHFPLCMRNLHRKFREYHHLKYDGRIQYHRFLKGVGWSVQDTLLFFRNEFLRVMPAAKFDKEYAYSIRHSYGLEGARTDYTPKDCHKLIVHGSAPRKGQYHGCPFRHWDAAQLSAELQGRSGLSAAKASQISSQAAAGNYQGACQQHFDASHPCSYAQATHVQRSQATLSDHSHHQVEHQPARLVTVNHPNAWVDASLQQFR